MAPHKSVLLNGLGGIAGNPRSSIDIVVKENVIFSAFYEYYDRYAHLYMREVYIMEIKIKFQMLNSKGNPLRSRCDYVPDILKKRVL